MTGSVGKEPSTPRICHFCFSPSIILVCVQSFVDNSRPAFPLLTKGIIPFSLQDEKLQLFPDVIVRVRG